MEPLITISLFIFLIVSNMMSNNTHEAVGLREEPLVNLVIHDSWASMNEACSDIHGANLYLGCTHTPIDKSLPCDLHITENLSMLCSHEYKHCQGYIHYFQSPTSTSRVYRAELADNTTYTQNLTYSPCEEL